MAIPVKLKRSGTTTATPSSLEYGELAINYADGVVFYRDSSDVIQSFTLQAYALASHTHSASDITSGTLDAARLPLATTGAVGGVIVGTGLGVSSGTVSVTYGTTSGTACQGNDSRLSDARTPTDGSVTTAKIADDAVTYAKLQNVSTTDRLLGRSSAGAGDVEEITCTAFGRSLIDDADAAAARTTLGAAPTASPTFSNAVTISAGNGLLDGLGNLRILTTDTQAIDKGGQIGLGGATGFGAPFDPWAFGVIKGAKENGTSGNFSGYLAFGTANAGGTISERLRIKSTGESEFTGSVVANNSGNVVPLTVTNTGTANSFVVNDASGDTSPFVIDASGNVGIGTSSPGVKLEVARASPADLGAVARFYHGPASDRSVEVGVFDSAGLNYPPYIQGRATTTTAHGLALQPDGGVLTVGGQLLVTAGSGSAGSYKPGIAVSGDDDTGIAQVGASPANTLSIVTNGSERVRVDASGNVGIGTSSPSSLGKFAVIGNIVANGGGTADPEFRLSGASGGVTRNYAIGTDAQQRLYIYDYTAAEYRLVINSSGQLLVTAGTASAPGVAISGDPNTGMYSPSADVLAFSTNQTERVRVDASGNVGIGTSTNAVVSDERLSVLGGAFGVQTSATVPIGVYNTNTAGTRQYIYFYVGTGTLTGTINTDGTTTSYNTTSDYRLKTVLGTLSDATRRLEALSPCEYAWKSTGQRGEGFLAHELAQSVPYAVCGLKDAVTEDGSIDPQQVDLSKIVPLLVKALQESNARIAALEERLNHA